MEKHLRPGVCMVIATIRITFCIAASLKLCKFYVY